MSIITLDLTPRDWAGAAGLFPVPAAGVDRATAAQVSYIVGQQPA
jgi:hypothetical protein